jgi:hypothetical protein
MERSPAATAVAAIPLIGKGKVMAGLVNWIRALIGHPTPGTPVFVDVYASGGPGNVRFDHRWRFQGGRTRTGRIEVPAKAKKERGTPIKFFLRNNTRPRVPLAFVDDDDAIWVDRTACPMTQARDREIINIRPSGSVLDVDDENQDACELHYNLRFEPNPQLYFYDPDIKNGGSN